MARMNMVQALNSAMDVMLGQDKNVVVMGEDVGYFGGVFRATEGLQQKFGVSRCFDAPIAEAGIVASAIGMGVYGLRPLIEVEASWTEVATVAQRLLDRDFAGKAVLTVA